MDDPDARQDAKVARSLECDIVMAGGVTSGIIYPGAVAMIARRYVFRSIGGTSVGAIAAAVAAAAEYGRRTGKNPAGFDEVASIPTGLGDLADDGHTRLFHLFAPEPTTSPLLTLVSPLFSYEGRFSQIVGIFMATMSWFRIGVPVIIALIAGLLVTLELVADDLLVLGGVALVMTVGLVAVTWAGFTVYMLAHRWLPAWRSNGYGICTGLSAPSSIKQRDVAPFEGLTGWIHGRIQSVSGRKFEDAPLTFGDLWAAPATCDAVTAVADPRKPRTIELSMIASDISRNRTSKFRFLRPPRPCMLRPLCSSAIFPPRLLNG